ncbi:probable 3-hydroxyisobutyrate dehydrogenase, mitochondrial [Halyomorpha halys]|uniref:probable 3-hydroxyisobutyrate dehydrogenase, mitochondrial n=1 Tax=Halyomorpha halys TaxID=286706 RepID=UPI0006D4E179|nr:probable 3-hydroxyisobutyrate dehydrogenase, mitochondrial [Halyomorpha halys]
MKVFMERKLLIKLQKCVFCQGLLRNDFRGLSTQSKVGFVGLGNMGEKMCNNLLKKDFKVMVQDLNPKKVELLNKAGAVAAEKNSDIAEFADFIITMLPASHHVTSFYAGENGIMKFIRPGTLAIDCSTVDHVAPKNLSNLFEKIGASIIDAPVSGGVSAALNGTLTFMVGGKEEDVDKAKPILSAMGKNIIHCGELGSGQIAKMCNNLLLGITMYGAAEIFHFGKKLGMDLKVLTSIINTSSGRCWVTDTYNPVPNVMENVPSSKGYEAGFTSQMLLKDLEIAERTAKKINHPLGIGNKTLEIYKQMCETDLREKDFSIIYEYLTNKDYYDKLNS